MSTLAQKPPGGASQNGPGGASQPAGAASSTTPHPVAVPGTSDIIPPTFISEPIDLPDPTQNTAKMSALDAALAQLRSGTPISWSSGKTLTDLATKFKPNNPATGNNDGTSPSCAASVSSDQAYVFHIKHWSNLATNSTDNKPVTLVSSEWYAYHHPRFAKSGTVLVRDQLSSAGNPLLYGSSTVLIIAIDRFDKVGTVQSAGKLTTTYSVTVTQDTPANQGNLSALIQGLGGIAAGFMGNTADTHEAYMAVSCQKGTRKLPFDLMISEAILQDPGSTAPQALAPGNVACSSGTTTPCAMTRTFTSVDREFWDIGLGLAVPGVLERTYAFSSSTSTTTASNTRHTEIYAFVDIFPFAYFLPKESYVPHVNLGVPLTTKSLYRPYFGLSENLTGWTHIQQALQLPTGINVFAGMVYMKTEATFSSLPTTQASFTSSLTYHRVWKPMFGIEVPVGALASKLGGKGGGSSASKSAAGSSKGGS